jgi:TRAP-type C4-dicarboxylate transport system permease large subunit
MTALCTALGVGALLALTPASTLAEPVDAPLTARVELHAVQPGVITFTNPLGRSRGPGAGFGNL